MAGLGLTEAVGRYQQGVQWQQQQDEIARQQQQRASVDEANRAAMAYLNEQSQGGKIPIDDNMKLAAAEMRSKAFADRGMWDQFQANEAQITPMRMQARAKALQDYRASGDAKKFLANVYPTLFDGKKIVNAEDIEAAPALSINAPAAPAQEQTIGLGQVGRPGSGQGIRSPLDGQPAQQAQAPQPAVNMAATPKRVKVTLSDGTEQVIDPNKIAEQLLVSFEDPRTTAEREIKMRQEIELARIKHDQEMARVREQGDQTLRNTDRHNQGTYRLGLMNAENQAAESAAEIASRERIANMHERGANARSAAGRENLPAMIAAREKVLGRKLLEPELLALTGLAPKRDPETGYETVETKTYNEMGQETGKNVRKVPIHGGAQGGPPPFKEGAEIRSKVDGKVYVVRNGQPVLKDGQASKPSAATSPAAGLSAVAQREPVVRQMQDGRYVLIAADGSTKTFTPEQAAVYLKMQSGEPTTPRERALLRD